MRKTRLIFFALFFAILLAPHFCFAAPASTYVDIGDRAYRDVEKLVSFRLVRPTMIDQRPFSKSTFARIVAEARGNFANQENDIKAAGSNEGYAEFSRRLAHYTSIKKIIGRLTEEFREELVDMGDIPGHSPLIRGHGLEEFRLDFIELKSPNVWITADNGVGSVSAKINPLVHYREGRQPIYGFQNAVETYHRIRITKHFAALAHPRFEANIVRPEGDVQAEAIFQEGYGVFQFGDAALTFGRKTIVWGPGEKGSLIITSNARPLDLIEISTPYPFHLPSFLKHLGLWRITLFGANLGPKQQPKYPWLTGYRLSYMPWRYLELGFANTTMMGGEGAPSLSAWDIFGEFFGFRVAGTDPDSPNKTNHIMEASVRVILPQVNGLELYGVLNNEDKRDTFKRFFRDGSSYLAGIYLPRIDNRGTSSLRFEFKRMSALAYRHGIYTMGYTLNNLFIGDDLGSDALGTHFRYDCDLSDKFSIGAIFDWDFRRSDLHTTTMDPDGTLGDIIVTQSRPAEERFRFVIEPSFQIGAGLKIVAMAGYERVENGSFVQGLTRNNLLAAVSLKIDLDKRFSFEVR